MERPEVKNVRCLREIAPGIETNFWSLREGQGNPNNESEEV